MAILILNPGSTTLKFQIFEVGDDRALRTVRRGCKSLRADEADATRFFAQATEQLLRESRQAELTAIGVRVVHGGEQQHEIGRVTDEMRATIAKYRDLAPLHTDIALQCIDAASRACPAVKSFAVFDTAFHNTMPAVARNYALPAAYRHLHRYGFHGISHRYVSRELAKQLKKNGRPASRLITCHLGNGSSLCALRDEKSVDTSMGFTPLEGLIMGTRSGDVDPGLVLYLARVQGMSPDEIDDLLNHKSGLLGLSGLSADTRDLEAAADGGNAQAEAALQAFAYRIRKYIGGYAAILGGIDAIAFTGGIGEHSPSVRCRIIRKLEFMGLRLSLTANDQALGETPAVISDGPVPIWVIPTDEERQIAEDIVNLLFAPTESA